MSAIEIINISNKLYISIKSIEKIEDKIYKIEFMNGQVFLLRGKYDSERNV